MGKYLFFLVAGCLLRIAAIAGEYHISVKGNDNNPGTATQPFRTINHAAQIAVAGDTITVHSGAYREWVNPKNGGAGDAQRIVYRAAPGEKVEIKGSEIITGWKKEKSGHYIFLQKILF